MEQSRETAPKPFCFVLMPFSDDFNDVYQLGIKEACDKAGAYCERVDEQIFQERILDRIYNQIAKADFIVADMTGKNANVFYEVGYAHALGTPTVLLTKDAADIPFDLKHFPHIVYGNQITALRDDLERRVKWFVENPRGTQIQPAIDIDLFLGDQNLSAGDAVYEYRQGEYPYPEITIHNASPRTFEPGDFKLGAESGEKYPASSEQYVTTTSLPNGRFLHMFPDFSTLFPNEYTSYKFILHYQDNKEPPIGDEEGIVLRVFTSFGIRDYPLTLRRVAADG